ncbi:MAG TPA: 30S ribosomal protein S17e [Nitrososphaeraceae archaeon]|jgi:small subunit ribosomal protein S17e|nr:30S ribosomal protein S17e [Nitrososphaeraceae archaeon]
MDRIKRISTTVLEKYPDRFGSDFEKNKQALQEIAITKSKILRNRVAGYITSYLRKQKVQEKMTEIDTDIETNQNEKEISEEKETNSV